jgi:hypothetical protein
MTEGGEHMASEWYERGLRELENCRWATLGALADAAEKAGNTFLAAGFRWLAEHRKWPAHRHVRWDSARQSEGWAYQFERGEQPGYTGGEYQLPGIGETISEDTAGGALESAVHAVSEWLGGEGTKRKEG